MRKYGFGALLHPELALGLSFACNLGSRGRAPSPSLSLSPCSRPLSCSYLYPSDSKVSPKVTVRIIPALYLYDISDEAMNDLVRKWVAGKNAVRSRREMEGLCHVSDDYLASCPTQCLCWLLPFCGQMSPELWLCALSPCVALAWTCFQNDSLFSLSLCRTDYLLPGEHFTHHIGHS